MFIVRILNNSVPVTKYLIKVSDLVISIDSIKNTFNLTSITLIRIELMNSKEGNI